MPVSCKICGSTNLDLKHIGLGMVQKRLIVMYGSVLIVRLCF